MDSTVPSAKSLADSSTRHFVSISCAICAENNKKGCNDVKINVIFVLLLQITYSAGRIIEMGGLVFRD